MVLADSHRISRVPRYSGTRFESAWLSPTWLSHSLAGLSRPLQLTSGLVTLLLRALQPRALHAKLGSHGTSFVPWVCSSYQTAHGISKHAEATKTSRAALGLGSSDFARRYSRNHCCFLFLQVLRWFTSLGLLLPPMDSVTDSRGSLGRVAPFGDPRISDCLRLPGAYRSLPRPSSPACAKASTVRP